MARTERPKTKAEKEAKKREDSPIPFPALRFIPDGFKLSYALHAIGRNKATQKGASAKDAGKGFHMLNETVYSFPKNDTEEVRLTLREYKERVYLDLRVWFLAKEGEYHPTKKGLSLSVEFLPELRKGLEKVKEAGALAGAR